MDELTDRVIVLANRAPFRHEMKDGRIVARRTASGLVTALQPLLEQHAGTWVAHTAGDADMLANDADGGTGVPPANSRYRLRYVALPEDQFRGYYYGFANEGLWPLCHRVDVTPVFRRADYEMYRAANIRFAEAVVKEADGESPIVLVQDYHFALAPRVLRQRMPQARIASFWHIPWPRPRTFMQCPWAAELLDGLCGSDVVGLQTDDDCRNFLACVEAFVPAARVDVHNGTIDLRGRLVTVRAYPVGVDCGHDALRSAPSVSACRDWARSELQLPADVRIGIGVDRLDYTKGITEKFLAIERVLETHPELVGTFVFVQIAEPTRDALAAYRIAHEEARTTCDRINQRFGAGGIPPIRLLDQHYDAWQVYRYYRAADVCFVASLHDGMNLVAKEFVAARSDERGVLVLSQFAGAAQQLRAALLVNPLRVDHSAEAVARALAMPAVEQATRMRVLRANVTSFDASWWAKELLRDASQSQPALVAEAAHHRWTAVA